MKKFIYYIVFVLSLVNPLLGISAPLPEKADKPIKKLNYQITNSAPEHIEPEEPAPLPGTNQKSIIKTDNELTKIIILPYLADKLFPGNAINQESENFIRQVYPTASPKTAKILADILSAAVIAKRRYAYVIKKLKQRIKATALLPQDAAPVAEDGEFAPIAANRSKTSPSGTYQISYTPYKYLEYDPGQLGEPVRRRDKNYVEKITNDDEIVLAILQFDLPAFFRALQKLPAATDGSAEKTGEFANGLKARLLLALSEPGEEQCIKAGFEIFVPQHYYIDGDILTPSVRPRFDLSEDPSAPANVKSYQIFSPESIGVVNNNVASRILASRVLIPAEFCRGDIAAPMHIKGNLTFTLCHKTGLCQPIATDHELTLKPSAEHTMSLYNNYIIQAFAELPPEQNKKASIKTTRYDRQNQTLTVTFALNSPISNIAAQAEDGAKTNFLNPRYAIFGNEASVTFDVVKKEEAKDSPLSIAAGAEIAVTAAFDETNTIRAVVIPDSVSSKLPNPNVPALPLMTAFILGLLLNLMPGTFYLFARLIRSFSTKPEKSAAILTRYALTSLITLLIISTLYEKKPFFAIYETPVITTAALFIAVSFLLETLNYMDFTLFRPLKAYFPRGIFIGFLTIILFVAVPFYTAPEVLTEILFAPWPRKLALIATLVLGLITLPAIACALNKRLSLPLAPTKAIGSLYNTITIIAILWLNTASRGFPAAIALIIGALLLSALWYIYPMAIAETVRHAKSFLKKQALFAKVQRHCAIAATVIYIITASLLALAAVKTPNLLTKDELSRLITENLAARRPLLVMLTADWSLASLINQKQTAALSQNGFDIIKIPYNNQNQLTLADEILKNYEKRLPPLNILFTNRHPNGIILPKNLKNIQWDKAFAELPGTTPLKIPDFPLTIEEIKRKLEL